MQLVRFLSTSIIWLAALGALLSLGSVFSQHHILFDLISHFRVQYIVLLIPAFLLAIVCKKTFSVLIISFALAVHGYVVTMTLLPVSPRQNTDFEEITVLNSNLLYKNTNYQAQLDIISVNDPDLIAFQEYTHNWHAELSSNLPNYPYRITKPMNNPFGIALYSKHPVDKGTIEVFSTHSFPAISSATSAQADVFKQEPIHAKNSAGIRST